MLQTTIPAKFKFRIVTSLKSILKENGLKRLFLLTYRFNITCSLWKTKSSFAHRYFGAKPRLDVSQVVYKK